jgi:DNA-binding response OmpR family regulator
MNRIALIEDHERIADLICRALSAAGIEADVYGRMTMRGRAWRSCRMLR